MGAPQVKICEFLKYCISKWENGPPHAPPPPHRNPPLPEIKNNLTLPQNRKFQNSNSPLTLCVHYEIYTL